MKRILILVVLLSAAVSGTAQAVPVNVDFSVLGPDLVDITISNNAAGHTLNGVTFHYDNFGTDIDSYGFPASAAVDSAGIFGSTFGMLSMAFTNPATALNFDFSLVGTAGPVLNGVFVLLNNAGNPVLETLIPADLFAPYDPADPTLGNASSSFAHAGQTFDQAQMLFSDSAPFFTVANVSYDTAAVPEPSSFLFLASGLLGIGGLQFMRRRGVQP